MGGQYRGNFGMTDMSGEPDRPTGKVAGDFGKIFIGAERRRRASAQSGGDAHLCPGYSKPHDFTRGRVVASKDAVKHVKACAFQCRDPAVPPVMEIIAVDIGQDHRDAFFGRGTYRVHQDAATGPQTEVRIPVFQELRRR